MNNSIDEAQNMVSRSNRLKRREKLFKILQLIMSGKIDSSKISMDKIFSQLGPRQEYISPKDRGSDNYGYMIGDETLGGTSFYVE
jgi:hypothetical protein